MTAVCSTSGRDRWILSGRAALVTGGASGETRPIDQIAPPPATVLSLEEVCDAVLRVIEDDSLAGRVLLLVGGEAPQFLSPRGG